MLLDDVCSCVLVGKIYSTFPLLVIYSSGFKITEVQTATIGQSIDHSFCSIITEMRRRHLRSDVCTCAVQRTQSQIGDRSFTAAGSRL